jgi:hypothetical protein
MQEKPIREPDRGLDEIERDIVYLLTDPNDVQPVWSLTDVEREVESEEDTKEAIKRLSRAGLVSRTADGHLVATRAAVRMVQLIGHGVV